MTKLGPLRTTIAYPGQSYVDEPIFEDVQPTPLALALRMGVGLSLRRMQFLVGYAHTPLSLKVPDPRDPTKLIPADQRKPKAKKHIGAK